MGHGRWAAWAAVLALLSALLLVAGPSPALSRPGPPRSEAAVPGNALVTVTWAAPASSGGARIDRYEVQRWRTGTTRRTAIRVGASVRRVVIRSLVNGVRYSFAVRAHNRAGWGRLGTTVSATPRTLPGGPGSVAATPGDASMHLTWLAPASNGGAPVDHYGLRFESPGDPSWRLATTDSGTDEVTGLSTTVHGLSNAAGNPYDIYPYRIQVRAHNAAGWGPWAEARLAPGAIRQAPPLVTNSSVINPDGSVAAAGPDAALRFGDWLRGVYVDGSGQPQGTGAVTVPIPSDCSTGFRIGCSGDIPQSPAPALDLDTLQQAGDLARTQVTLVSGQTAYDVTLRTRVATSEPVDFTSSGSACTMAVDSTGAGGASPDWVFQMRVTFSAGTGWHVQPTASNVTLSGTETNDFTVGGQVTCQFMDTSTVIGAFRAQAATSFQQYVDHLLADTCGADVPSYWEHCYPILENVPLPPTPATAAPRCPTAPPPAGPYMTTSCSSSGALVKTCATGWKDTDGAIADGCEQRVAGVVPMELDVTTAQALADHLSGSFWLGGYGGDPGTWYDAPSPRATLPLCGSTLFGCPFSEQQVPMPQLVLDLADHGEPDPRRSAAEGTTPGTVVVTLRFRLSSTGAVAFVQDGVGCQVQIAPAEVTLNVGVMGSGTGPPTITGISDQSGDVTLQGLSAGQPVVGPSAWCELHGGWERFGDIDSWLRQALLAWAQSRASSLCGAPAPYYWQGCS